MTREACIHEMNRLGKLGTPFCFLIDFEENAPKIWQTNPPPSDFWFSFNGKACQPDEQVQPPAKTDFRFQKHPQSYEHYKQMFDITHAHIQQGDSYLVNLTGITRVETDLSLKDIYRLGISKYKCILLDQFVSFSPETFVRIENGRITACPMKGTIDANLPNAKQIILQDPKEAAEHATIVDLIRNDISRIAKEVRVERYRYFEIIHNHAGALGQVSSEISGQLADDYPARIGDILFSMLPAGSVSGAPKKRTLEIIREAERIPRGYFAGVAGYVEAGRLDSCVLIRFLQSDGFYRSGGGITHNSIAKAEYQEMIDKVYVPIH